MFMNTIFARKIQIQIIFWKNYVIFNASFYGPDKTLL